MATVPAPMSMDIQDAGAYPAAIVTARFSMFMRKTIVCLFVTAALAGPSAFAQKPPTPPTGGGSKTPAPPTVTTPPPNIPNTTSISREPRRVLYLTGRVLFDDGTAPTGPVYIERICNGRTWREGHTNLSGHFSIQLGQNIEVADASAEDGEMPSGRPSAIASLSRGTQGVPENQLYGCELRANYAGAYSESVPLAGRHAMDNTDVGTIVLHRMGKVEGTKVSVTTLQAPKDARKAFERAKKAAAKQKWPEAQQDLEKAVTVYPAYAEAWSLLGVAYKELRRPTDATHAFERALQQDSKYMEPYFQLAAMAAQDQNWARLAELTDKALTLDAYEYPALYYYNALAGSRLNKLEAAEKSARTARRLDSRFRIPQIELVLTSIFLQRQDWAGAAQQLREYLQHTPTGPDADRARAKLAELERHMGPAESSKQK